MFLGSRCILRYCFILSVSVFSRWVREGAKVESRPFRGIRLGRDALSLRKEAAVAAKPVTYSDVGETWVPCSFLWHSLCLSLLGDLPNCWPNSLSLFRWLTVGTRGDRR